MHPLTALICGDALPGGSMGEVLSHLADNLDRLLVKGSALRKGTDSVDIALYGPFLGRATLEVSLTAICARFDPFRVLAIRRSQMVPEFDIKSRNPLAFNWSADVQGDDKPKDWEQKPNLKELQRALLCKHFHDVFWQEAFTLVLDSVPTLRGAEWMGRLKKIYPEGFTTSMRTEADRLFSELSKGIHHEFVIPLVSQYDAATVGDLLTRCWEFVAALGITSCHSPIARPLVGEDAITCYEQAQSELIS
jgi:hypothetical protein